MERKITAEELLTDDQWNALGLSDDDVLITKTYVEESYDMNVHSRFVLYEKDNKFYQKESAEKFDGTIETVYYPLSEEEASAVISSYLNSYELFNSQFSYDENAHFSVVVEVTPKVAQYVNEDDKYILDNYFPDCDSQTKLNKDNGIDR